MNHNRIIIYVLFLSIYIFGFSLWEASPEYQFHLKNRYAGRLEFLTNLGLIITCIASLFGLLFEIYPQRKNYQKYWYFFLGISFPLESVIFCMYWSIVFYDRGLVASRELLSRGIQIPVFTDLALHFFPTVGLYLDLFIFAKTFVSSRAHVFSLIAFNNAYIVYCHILYHLNDKAWVYPLLGVLTERQHIILVMTTTTLCLVFYFLGKETL